MAYINREKAFELITDFAGTATTKSAYAAFWKSARALNKLPTADVVEVVRCKDCKWWYNEMDCRNTSGLYRFVPNGNWFCASGERREQ